MQKAPGFTVSVAPMMDWTDRHCRWFHRQLSSHVLLYTEMVTANAIIHGDRNYLIGFNPAEHPIALQIGGSEPLALAQAAKIGEDFGYDEININIGCPSDRVQSGRFGACLMAEPDLVAQCYSAMSKAVDIPVTVKCRLGIDDQNLNQTLPEFIEKVSSAGCEHFIIHARKAWLKGLSPKENRDVPPLNYDLVKAMKAAYPALEIVLNGGLKTLAAAQSESEGLNGVMFGRAAYHSPWILTDIDQLFYGAPVFSASRQDITENIIDYVSKIQDTDRSAKAIIRHIMGLYAGQAGARHWRRTLSEGLAARKAPSDIIQSAALTMRDFGVPA